MSSLICLSVCLLSLYVYGYIEVYTATQISYLKHAGVLLYSSSTLQEGEGVDVVLVCTKDPLSLQKVNVYARIRSLQARNCVIGRISHSVAYHLLALGVEYLEMRSSQVQVTTQALQVFRQSLKSFSMINCTELENFEMQEMINLKKLSLVELSLNNLPSGVDRQNFIEELDLSGNQLSPLASTAEWRSLKKLYLANNKLSGEFDISAYIQAAPKLEYLDLSNNFITSLTTTEESNSLSCLDLSSNSLIFLESVTTMMSYMPKLKVLNLSHNYITTITGDELRSVQMLEMLDLRYNNLTHLHKSLYKISLPLLFRLEGNAWKCDCHMIWLLGSEEFSKQILPSCQTPYKFRYFTINNFPAPDACELV